MFKTFILVLFMLFFAAVLCYAPSDFDRAVSICADIGKTSSGCIEKFCKTQECVERARNGR